MELLKSETERILIESHRGAEGLGPEISWPSLKIGKESGADFLEIDIQLSKDNIAFLHHNYTLPDNRNCSNAPWIETKNIIIQNEVCPLLEDVLIWAHENNICLSLDLKVGFTPQGQLVKEVLRLLKHTAT